MTRWIFASLSLNFNQAAIDANIPMFIEGQDRETADLQQYYEFRMNGPRFIEVNKNFWHADVEIDILCIQKRTEKNNHLIYDLCGIMFAACIPSIPVYKFGNGPDDNSTVQVGCINLTKHLDDRILVTHLGQLGPDLVELQSSIEAYYRLELDT
jgi:hypothetical protein